MVSGGGAMKGFVAKIIHHRGMVAVLTESNRFTILEMIGGDPIQEGDDVSWENDTALGPEVLSNLSQNQKYEVYFQDHGVGHNNVLSQLIY